MEDDFPYDLGLSFFRWPIVFGGKYWSPNVVPGFSDREEVHDVANPYIYHPGYKWLQVGMHSL